MPLLSSDSIKGDRGDEVTIGSWGRWGGATALMLGKADSLPPVLKDWRGIESDGIGGRGEVTGSTNLA